jgi:hypothetical protein
LPPQPARPRTYAGPAFSPLKKFTSHFFNTAFGGTGEKEAPYAGTGENANMNFFIF